jgi:hypothetical protein
MPSIHTPSYPKEERERERVNKRSTLSLSLYIIDRYTCIWLGIPIHFLFHNLFLFPLFFLFLLTTLKTDGGINLFWQSPFLYTRLVLCTQFTRTPTKQNTLHPREIDENETDIVCVCVCNDRPKNGLKKDDKKTNNIRLHNSLGFLLIKLGGLPDREGVVR